MSHFSTGIHFFMLTGLISDNIKYRNIFNTVRPRFTAGVGGRQKPAVNRGSVFGVRIGQIRWEMPSIHIRDIFYSLTIEFSKLIVSKC